MNDARDGYHKKTTRDATNTRGAAPTDEGVEVHRQLRLGGSLRRPRRAPRGAGVRPGAVERAVGATQGREGAVGVRRGAGARGGDRQAEQLQNVHDNGVTVSKNQGTSKTRKQDAAVSHTMSYEKLTHLCHGRRESLRHRVDGQAAAVRHHVAGGCVAPAHLTHLPQTYRTNNNTVTGRAINACEQRVCSVVWWVLPFSPPYALQ